MKQFDVITVGNCMIDAFMTIQSNNMFSHIDRENKQVCFQFGEKIHVDRCEFMLGGNACNVGVGLSRLGFQTGLYAEIGDDEFSQKILSLLTQESINSSLLIQTKGEASSFAIGINYSDERTLFVDHIKRSHNFIFSGVDSKWIYITSLGIEWKHAYLGAINYKGYRNLAFSPGSHQMEAFDDPSKYKEEKNILENILQKTDILFVNREEGERIVGRKTSSVNSLLSDLHDRGPKVVSVTDGKDGAYCLDGDGKMLFIETFPNVAVEKTGAGDAYAAGFLGAYMTGLSVDEAMRWGSMNAASVVEKTGAQPGLLSRQEIEKKLSEQNDFKAKEI